MSPIAFPRRFVSAPVATAKAGPIGSGASVLLTEFPLVSVLGNSPQRRMRKAWQMGISTPWIRAAERVIAGAFASVHWHLEDQDDVEIDDDYKGDLAQEARSLIAKPYANLPIGQRMTRSDLWRITARHMGLCGNGFWLLDEPNAYGIPRSTIYVRPDRWYPVEDNNGNLIAWDIKNNPNEPGVRVSLEQVLHFVLEPPDEGHFGAGLVESALLKAQLSTGLDTHLGQLLSAGGRLAGILSPKLGAMDNDDQYNTLVRDTRTIVEQPDAAKRIQILRFPAEFTPTAMTPQEWAIRDLMTGAADDLLALWGVPKSVLGLHDRGRGMGASTVTLQDEATFWKNAVHPRLGSADAGGFVEVLQGQMLDRYVDAGQYVELEIDEPQFDDDAAKYTEAQQAVSVPLRSSERRAILGLEPFGPDIRDPGTGILLDDEIWMPGVMVKAFVAPSDGTKIPEPEPEPVPPPLMGAAALAAGETTEPGMEMAGKVGATNGKAPVQAGAVKARSGIATSLAALRSSVAARMTPRLEAAAAAVLTDQRREIAAKVRAFGAHIALRPADTSVWWDGAKWDRRMRDALRPQWAGVASTVATHARDMLAPVGKAKPVTDAGAVAVDEGAAEFLDRILGQVIQSGAARVTAINETTRTELQELITKGIEDGLSPSALGDLIEASTPFDEYRSELIGRTELMNSYNAAALGSYGDLGVEQVQAIDGDADEMCANRNGNYYTLDEAATEEEHPNGTLDWVPVIA